MMGKMHITLMKQEMLVEFWLEYFTERVRLGDEDVDGRVKWKLVLNIRRDIDEHWESVTEVFYRGAHFSLYMHFVVAPHKFSVNIIGLQAPHQFFNTEFDPMMRKTYLRNQDQSACSQLQDAFNFSVRISLGNIIMFPWRKACYYYH